MKKIIIVILIIFLSNMAIVQCNADTIKIRVSPDILDFHVEDMNGKISGYTDTQLLLQIPYMDAYWSTTEVNEPNPTLYQKWNELYTSNSEAYIPPGKYKLVVYGTGLTTATQIRIYIDMVWNQKGAVRVGYGNTIFPGTVWIYEFDIPATPPANGQITLTKVSNPANLITDINISNQLGYFTTPGMYQSLLSKAQEAQAKLLAGQTIPAKNVLNALINDINAQRGKQINTIAADILIKDAQYIIAH